MTTSPQVDLATTFYIDNRYVTIGRLCQAVKRAARKRGITGDPLAETRQLGTMNEEFLAIEILLDVPREIKNVVPDLAWKMARAVVLSHGVPTR